MTTIERTRLMPVMGTLTRRVGERVPADAIVAQAEQSMGYRLLDLEKLMGHRIPDVREVLLKKRNEKIEKDEVIARVGALIKSEYVSPVSGTLLDARGSTILIEVTPQEIELAAFYSGTIVKTVPGRGVVLQVTGAVIQGVWGMGDLIRARLEQAASDGDTSLRADQIEASQAGTILLGGRGLDQAALEMAVEVGVKGVIVGSISSGLLSVLDQVPLAVIVTEAFGDIGMNPHTFELLRSFVGREVCFDPRIDLRWEGRRPEIVIPMSANVESVASQSAGVLQVGMRVRALRSPYQGVAGKVMALPLRPRLLPSGIRVVGAQVDLELVGPTWVPLNNLEIVA